MVSSMQERPADDGPRPPDRLVPGDADDLLLRRRGSGRRREGDGVEGLLADWTASIRHHDDTSARARQRWLRQQLEEESTFSGLLLDLAERGLPVVVQGRGSRVHRGVLSAVASDCVVLRAPSGVHVLLAYHGIAWIRPEEVSGTPTGDRGVSIDLGVAELLAALVGERPRVLIVSLDHGEGLAGELRAVGQDVVTIRLEAGVRSTVFVPVGSISEMTIEG
jgi:hypothetical protein